MTIRRECFPLPAARRVEAVFFWAAARINRAFELHLCIEQVAELIGNILAVSNNGCGFVDGSELRKTIRCIVVADGIDGNVYTCNDILCLRELITGIAVTIRQDKDDWRAISAEFLRFFIDTVHCNTKTVIHSGIAVRVEGIYSTLVQIGIDSLNGATPWIKDCFVWSSR